MMPEKAYRRLPAATVMHDATPPSLSFAYNGQFVKQNMPNISDMAAFYHTCSFRWAVVRLVVCRQPRQWSPGADATLSGRLMLSFTMHSRPNNTAEDGCSRNIPYSSQWRLGIRLRMSSQREVKWTRNAPAGTLCCCGEEVLKRVTYGYQGQAYSLRESVAYRRVMFGRLLCHTYNGDTPGHRERMPTAVRHSTPVARSVIAELCATTNTMLVTVLQ